MIRKCETDRCRRITAEDFVMKNVLMYIVLFALLGSPAAGQSYTDDFEGSILDPEWSWTREDVSHWSLGGGRLTIRTQHGALNGERFNNVYNILLRDSPDETFWYETKLDFLPGQSHHNAGLIYYIDDDNYIRVSRGVHGTTNGLWMEWEIASETHFHFVNHLPESPVWLRLSRSGGTRFLASFSHNGSEYYKIGTEVIEFPGQEALIGLQAANGDGLWSTHEKVYAHFEYFKVTQTTGIAEQSVQPSQIAIRNTWPNPLNAGSPGHISFTLASPADVELFIVDVLGRVVGTVVSARLSPGEHIAVFQSAELRAGQYFLHLSADRQSSVKTISIVP